jgi:hypothetical protein
MALSAVDVISPAFEHMKRQLFSPFRFGQWVRLAVVGFLAGEMSMGGGCSGPPSGGGGGGSVPSPPIPGVGPPGVGGALFFIGIGILALLGVALAVAFVYVYSRMRFVLFDSVLAGECRIREFWGRRGPEAFRLFVFQILFVICTIVGMALLFGLPLLAAFAMGWLQNPSQHLLPLILGGVVLVFAFLAVMLTLAVTQVFIKDFVVPQMALERVSVGEGWNRLWTMVKEEKGGYAAYIGMKIVLAIAAGIGLGIVFLIALLLVLIPVGGFGVVAVLGARAAGMAWNPVTIAVAIVVGLIVLIGLMLLASLISVPSIAFFPAYAIHFFAERYAPLKTALVNSPSRQGG